MEFDSSTPHRGPISHASASKVAISPSPSGLLLNCTSSIKEFLSSHSLLDATLSQYIEADVVPYKLVRYLWAEMPSDSRPRLRHLLAGSTFVLKSPEPRRKSDELKARLERLQDLADRKAYNDLLKDVAREEQEREYFSSYKDQLGLGLHVVVTMFTGYLVGYALFRSQFGMSPVLHAAGGISGMVIAMLLETLLFIVRSSLFEERRAKSKAKAGSIGESRLKLD